MAFLSHEEYMTQALALAREAAERIRAQVRTKAFEAELESRLQAESC